MAPLSTAKVRAITRPVVDGGPTEALRASEPLAAPLGLPELNSFAFVQAAAVLIAYVRQAVATASERRK